MSSGLSSAKLDWELVSSEFPSDERCLYLNTGSSGRKPVTVMKTLARELEAFNANPTITTFLDEAPWESARQALGKLIGVSGQQLILTQNTTQGLQLAMHSLLKERGDELITTNHEHGSVVSLARYFAETRGTVTKVHNVDVAAGGAALCLGLLDLITPQTKLIVVSEIFSYTGWHPDLSLLIKEAKLVGVPVLVDGAHSPGQVDCSSVSSYALWTASGHKWLGGPSGTGCLYVSPGMVSEIEPVWIGDDFYNRKGANPFDLRQFEAQGTCDVLRWYGLTDAVDLQVRLGPEQIRAREAELVRYLRAALEGTGAIIRTPLMPHDRGTAMLTFYFEGLPANFHFREALWQRYQIWIQPDFIGDNPGHGMRISCHYSLHEAELDVLIRAITNLRDKSHV